MSPRVLLTGSRSWKDRKRLTACLTWLGDTLGGVPVLVHGGAGGADRMAATVAERLGWSLEEHPASWALGRTAGLARNAAMVRLGADVVVTCWDGSSPGTRHCAALAHAAGLRVVDVGASTSRLAARP